MSESEKQQRAIQESKVIAHEYPKQAHEEPVSKPENRKPIIQIKKKRTFVKPE
jgi:hypothetical protein